MDVEIIDLSNERDKILTSTVLKQAIDILEKNIALETDEAKKDKMVVTLANKVERYNQALKREFKDSLKDSVDEDELTDEEALAIIDAEMVAFIEEHDIHFIKKLNRYIFPIKGFWEKIKGENVYSYSSLIYVKKSDLNYYHAGLEPKSSNLRWHSFTKLLREHGREWTDITAVFYLSTPRACLWAKAKLTVYTLWITLVSLFGLFVKLAN